MPLVYSIPPSEFPLRQCEIIENLLEIFPIRSEDAVLRDDSSAPPVVRRMHPRAVIVTQDCDLNWDWQTKQEEAPNPGKLLNHIQFCPLYQHDEIRWDRGFNSKLWERVTSNQDERYHQFLEASVGEDDRSTLPILYADFKNVFSLACDFVYWQVSSGFAVRRALINNRYGLDFIHRLFSYLSRVAVIE